MKRNDLEKYITNLNLNDSGYNGKAFEIACKYALNGRVLTRQAVTSKGKTDTTHKGLKFEIKSNCGTLDSIENNDFVIYGIIDNTDLRAFSIDELVKYALENAHVFTSADFMQCIFDNGLYRIKKSTSGHEVSAIQSFKNSKRKYAAWSETINNRPSLAEWLTN